MSESPRRHARTYPLAVTITISLCAFWGLAHGFYWIVAFPFFRFFGLTSIARELASSSLSITYIIVAIPAALFLRRLGYKLAIVLGLSAFSVGAFLFYPAVAQHQVLFFVAAIIATSIGWAFLETSANPLIFRMGSPDNAVVRLNFAQAFYPLGYVVATLLGRRLAVPYAGIPTTAAVEVLMRPYIIVGLVVLLVAFLIENVEFPHVAESRNESAMSTRQELKKLLARREFQYALAAMCAAMIGLVAVVSLTAPYIARTWPVGGAFLVPQASIVFWIAVGIGRFTGTALMLRWDPLRMLAVAGAASAAFLCLAVACSGAAGVACLLGAALCLSITFPTIFGEAIRNTGDLIKSASGLLVIAAGLGSIAGGNLVQWTTPAGHIPLALLAAAACFALVFAAAVAIRRRRHQNAMIAV